MIPIEDYKWRRVDTWPGLTLPAGHKLEIARTGKDEITARVTGPRAHVFGNGPDFDEAIRAAVEWFNSVGGEL